MLAGMLLGVLFYRPIFQQLYQIADTSIKTISSEKINKVEGIILSSTATAYSDGTMLITKTTQVTPNEKPQIKKDIILADPDKWKMIFLIATMVLFVTMVYGPIAAFLVELFPTRIRYTSMSLPYHIGNGVFGGLVPFIATLITTLPGTDHLSGLWYPIGIAALCFVIGSLYLTDKKNENQNNL